MVAESPRVLYRLIQTASPTLRDFLSHQALGIEPLRPLSARGRDRWRGLSHHDTLDAARAKGSQSPWLGHYVAEVRVPAGAAIRIEQTVHDPTHYTLWADPAALLSWVVSVTPVEPVH
jgi:hypothetical protein